MVHVFAEHEIEIDQLEGVEKVLRRTVMQSLQRCCHEIAAVILVDLRPFDETFDHPQNGFIGDPDPLEISFFFRIERAGRAVFFPPVHRIAEQSRESQREHQVPFRNGVVEIDPDIGCAGLVEQIP